MTTVRRNRRALLTPLVLVGVVAALPLFLAQAPAAHAAAIAVNTTDDELNADGDCSLREAIEAANTDAVVDACAAGSGADTIDVPGGTYTLSIAGAGEDANATGDLDITADLTISGAGAATTIIDGAALDRVFHVLGGTVEISGLAIQNGSADGGGIYNTGSLTVTDSTVSGNTAGSGGGVHNSGSLTVVNGTFSGNSAALYGGGILNEVGTVTVTDSTFLGNPAGIGGGISNFVNGTLAVTNSTFSGNSSSAGGGIHNNGALTVTNSTFSDNSAGFYGGGGIFSSYGTLTVTNATFSGNSAGELGGGGIADGGFGTVILRNSIVANSPSGGNCSGTVLDGGGNLSWPDSTCPGINQDPLLDPAGLQDNGGPTQTHALLAGSPAIDAGSPDCPPPATDQRGVARPLDGDGDGTPVCDIGAFEVETPPPACAGVVATITGTTGPDLLIGTSGSDIIVGLAGNDLIFGLGGDDLICGDAGNDVIIAGGGNDILIGGADNDTLAGGAGFDGCIGGAGSDTPVACEVTFGIP